MADLKLFLKDAVGLLKSGSQALALMGSKVLEYLYHTRVRTAGGITLDRVDMDKMLNWLIENDLYDDTKLLYLSNAGMVQRIDGTLKYIRTAFDGSGNNNDLDGSATASRQPRLVGGIAPNSKVAASNLKWQSRYFTHPEIRFEATDAWSAVVCLSITGNSTYIELFGGNNIPSSNCMFAVAWNNPFLPYFRNLDGTGVGSFGFANDEVYRESGKYFVIHLIADGLGNLNLYIEAKLVSTLVIDTKFSFVRLFGGHNTNLFTGKINYYRIQQNALTPAQVLAEHTFLRTLYPEIETVTVDKTIASRNIEPVATCRGNVIPDVKLAGAVEKITNVADREFSSDTGWWLPGALYGTSNISGGVLNLNTTSQGGYYRNSLLTANKYYKVTYTIVSIDLGEILERLGDTIIGSKNTVGTHQFIGKSTGNGHFRLYTVAAGIATIDNVSVQELNWSNATEIYDAVYAARITAGDTPTLAMFEALKEAAMWRYPYDNLDYGAVMSKQYNWYAAKLFQYDIEQYNLANPTATWGYHVATNQDYIDIATELDGSEVAGKKMKMNGTTYWVTDNGTNESGITALGSGIIGADGVDTGYKEITGFWTADEYDADRGYAVTLHDELDNLIIQE